MANRQKPYLYQGQTTSLCSQCAAAVPAKIILQDGAIYLLKRCPEHGEHRELLEEDAGWYQDRLAFEKPGTFSRPQTETARGCPRDCGLCPDHEQHTCIGLLEVTNRCDLGCPVCYARSGSGEFLDLPAIERMLDLYLDSEDDAEILQISGGEPSLHPHILDIIRLAKSKKFRFVMLNTNGLRIATDPAFARALHEFYGGFEVYLQFDGFSPRAGEHLRGRDVSALKQQAVKNLADAGVPMTLVSTIQAGVNDEEVGRIIEFGLNAPFVRGINFQPVAFFGRHPKAEMVDRTTLTGILRRIEQQTNGMVKMSDFIPLPCNVDRVAISFLYKGDHGFFPVLRNARVKEYLPLIKNTLQFDARDILTQTAKGLVTGQQFCSCLSFLKDFLPLAPVGKNLRLENGAVKYNIENTFRLSVTSFLDRYNFEMRAMKKECVHILTPDLRKIPFSAYNLFYRDREGRDA